MAYKSPQRGNRRVKPSAFAYLSPIVENEQTSQAQPEAVSQGENNTNGNGLDQGGDKPMATYPRIGEQHPEGTQVKGKPQDNLDFGWFSMPANERGQDSSRSDNTAGGGSMQGGGHQDYPGPQNDQYPTRGTPGLPGQQPGAYPLSRQGARPESQQAGPGEYRPDSREQLQYAQQGGETDEAVGRLLNEPGYASQGSSQPYPSQYQFQPTQPPSDDRNVIVDWPLSAIAQSQGTGAANIRPQMQGYQPYPVAETPAPSGRPQVPPTPHPPLQWEPYRNTSRPTYASWHDQWHGSHDPNYKPPQRGNLNNNFFWNDNNNNNNNNNLDASGDGTDDIVNSTVPERQEIRQGLSNKSGVLFERDTPILCRKLTTLSPHGQASRLIPQFYNPSVVMQWESTDNQDRPSLIKQRAPKTFMKSVRSNLNRLLAICSCLKVTAPGPDHRARLFQYNRFDGKEKSSADEA